MCTIPLSLSTFDWSFTFAAVDRSILGADCLRNHQFDVSLAHHLLVSVNGDVSLPLMSSSSPSTLLSKISVQYQEIMLEFLEIVGIGFVPSPVKHGVRHHVVSKGPPISMPARPLDLQKYTAEFEMIASPDHTFLYSPGDDSLADSGRCLEPSHTLFYIKNIIFKPQFCLWVL